MGAGRWGGQLEGGRPFDGLRGLLRIDELDRGVVHRPLAGLGRAGAGVGGVDERAQLADLVLPIGVGLQDVEDRPAQAAAGPPGLRRGMVAVAGRGLRRRGGSGGRLRVVWLGIGCGVCAAGAGVAGRVGRCGVGPDGPAWLVGVGTGSRRRGVRVAVDGRSGIACRPGVRGGLRGRVGLLPLRGGADRAGLPGGGQPPPGALVRAVERLRPAGVVEGFLVVVE